MLTWLFERKIFSPTISDLSTFLFKKCSRRKIGDTNFYIRLYHIISVYVYYINFLTAKGKQSWHKFINILLCSIVKWPFNWQSDLIDFACFIYFLTFSPWDWQINYDRLSSAKNNYECAKHIIHAWKKCSCIKNLRNIQRTQLHLTDEN